MGNGYSVAWRELDAQHWGVPQRRKRIYLVGDFTGTSAGKILFESEGLSGYTAEGFRAWQRAAGSIEERPGETGRVCLNDQGGQRMDITEDATTTLRATGKPPFVLEEASDDAAHKGDGQTLAVDIGGGKSSCGVYCEQSPTLTCTHGGAPAIAYDGYNGSVDKVMSTLGTNCGMTTGRNGVLASDSSNAVPLDWHPHDSRIGICEEPVVQTLTSRMGTGGNNVPLVMEEQDTPSF